MQQSNYGPANSAPSNSPLEEECLQYGVLKYGQCTIKNTIIKYAPVTDLPYQPHLKERAKSLRRAGNLSEVLFWMQVTKGKFHKIDFDRQRVIGNYIVDFYVKKLGLVIEIDGSSHDNKIEYDRIREDYLISLGLKVYRITVGDVMRNMHFVIIGLENYIITEYGME
ncbi:endonuclease domain-containing protein [Pedobacter punctiformis]|uniref:Endonuclease domain-containing protein n=1 Tax=Pedobacter punctiformis TaxID=3004097 RepID=A0ABT4L4K8_9SPHI|nr:endonuclease domain-containing protein [Pedobacter sp. HCMS5-2]MCZ4242842.1 endonuclease domain-containing protein [Pedobacter sp. HCMS5-2]